MIRSIWIWQWNFTQESSFPLIDGLVKTQAVRPSEVKPKVHHLKWFCPSRGASFWGIITKMALFQILSSWVICHLPGSFACFCLPTVFSISDRCWTTCTCHEGCLDAWFGIGTRQHWWRDMKAFGGKDTTFPRKTRPFIIELHCFALWAAARVQGISIYAIPTLPAFCCDVECNYAKLALSRIIVKAQQYMSWRILVNNFRAPQCLSVYWVFDFRIIMISPKNFWYSWVIRLVSHPSYPQGSTRMFFDSVLHLNKSKEKKTRPLYISKVFFLGGGLSGLRVLYFFIVSS